MNMGKALLRIRKEQGVTQGAVGAKAGLAVSYVSRIENDHVQPTMTTLGRLASALDTPLSVIFQMAERGVGTPRHRCPVSASGRCIGEQIRSDHGRPPQGGKAHYGRQEMRILKMADQIALHGSKDVRKALLLVLESFMTQQASV